MKKATLILVFTGAELFAGPLLTFHTGPCSVGVSAQVAGTPIVCQETERGSAGNGATGMHLSGEATAEPLVSEGGAFNVSFNWQGTADGFLLSFLPVTWDFFVFTNLSESIGFTYTLDFNVGDESIHESGGPIKANPAGREVTGSDFFEFPVGQVSSWSVVLAVTVPEGGEAGSTMRVLVPDSSVDINAAAVPEPGSSVLMVVGVGVLGLKARRDESRRGRH